MAGIHDLPLGILLMVFSVGNVSQKDAVNAVRVCKAFHAAALPNIYNDTVFDLREIHTNLYAFAFHRDLGHSSVFRHPEWIEGKRKVCVLLKTLSQNSSCSANVRSLKLAGKDRVRRGVRWEGSHQFDNKLSWNLLEHLPQLRALHLFDDWIETLLKSNPTLSRLETLRVGGCRGDYTWKELYWASCQPRLRKLYLSSLPRIADSPHLSEKLHSSNISEIFLDETGHGMVQQRCLETLLTLPKALRTFFWVLDKFCNHLQPSHQSVRELGSCKQLPASAIAQVLQGVQQCLERLTITYGCCGRCWKDSTVLDTLVGFKYLRYLRIEPSLVLGRRCCPRFAAGAPWKHSPNVRPPQELARFLPASLETIYLEIEQEQCHRVHDYAFDMMRGILDDRQRLQQIRTVMFQEINAGYESQCRCVPFRNACYLRQQMMRLDEVELKQIALMQRQCFDAGINMKYLAVRDENRAGNLGKNYWEYAEQTVLEFERTPVVSRLRVGRLSDGYTFEWPWAFETGSGEGAFAFTPLEPLYDVRMSREIEEDLLFVLDEELQLSS